MTTTPLKKNLIVIPSRLKATRLPNKPLADIAGRPMIVHVYEKVRQAGAGDVVVACAEPEVAQVVEAAGGRAILTDPNLPAGTDRVAAAWKQVPNWDTYDAVVNVQGDMPTLEPRLVAETINAFHATPDADIMTPVTLITDPGELTTDSVVKVATGKWDAKVARALYFSRSRLPHYGDRHFHHVGLYVLRPAKLERYVTLPQTQLELDEKLEQLRALEDGYRIFVNLVDTATPFGVDTPDDLEKARHSLGHYA